MLYLTITITYSQYFNNKYTNYLMMFYLYSFLAQQQRPFLLLLRAYLPLFQNSVWQPRKKLIIIIVHTKYTSCSLEV